MTGQFETITDYQSFLALRESWNTLAETSPAAHAFFRHEWYENWLKHLNVAGNFAFSVVRDGSDLIAAAPMQFVTTRLKGFPVRALMFAGSTVTPRNAFLFADGVDRDAFFEYVYRSSKAHLVIANQAEADLDPTKSYLEWLHGRRLKPVIESARLSPFLTTDSGWKAYWESLSGSFRTLLQRGERKLEKAGEVEMRPVPSYAEFKTLLPELTEVSSRSWKADDHTDLGSLPQVVAFLDDYCRMGEQAGLWECWILRLNGKLVAFQFYLRHRRKLSLIRTDFDRDFSQLSPGRTLQLAVVRDLFGRDGVWEYDMGGHVYDYKRKWTNRVRRHVDIWSAGPNWYGRALMFGKRRILPLVTGRPASPEPG